MNGFRSNRILILLLQKKLTKIIFKCLQLTKLKASKKTPPHLDAAAIQSCA